MAQTTQCLCGNPIAQDCANVAGVPVSVSADLVIAPKQKMLLMARKKPEVNV